ncbi:MAG: ABC transporter substrate-binding protein [Proteobacteria bacterium]|nr:ABC transporter substrate-binding protein [Pseudomonadota bacterium]
MIRAKILTAVLLLVSWSSGCLAIGFEPPLLANRVAAGELEPMQGRLPLEPLISAHDDKDARYGGTMRLLFGKSKDIRQMVVYGYSRLVGYDLNLELKADILKDFTVEEGRIFTFHLREGHRWSDGQPFTSEAFRYYWEDMANNEGLSPFGPPQAMLVEEKPPRVDIIDELTVRYTWHKPNPVFLTKLAEPRPMFIYAPGHYLRQYHENYNDPDVLAAKVKESGRRNWVSLHHFSNRQYKLDNPELPSLQPWYNTTRKPAERFIFVRNPWFHRVDKHGRQLPYIDRVAINIVDKSLIAAKTGSGESDLQGRYLNLTDYTFLKESETRQKYQVYLWGKGTGAQAAIFPNLNSEDPVWRELVRDVRFRRALSLGINRHEINQVIYFGLANESNNTVLPGSPLYRPAYQSAWADYDPDQANALLDELGLDKRDKYDIRQMKDGRSMEVILHTAGESTEETDILELIRDSWHNLGIKLLVNPSQREVFRQRIFSGHAMISMFSGIDNGLPSAAMSPEEFAPVNQSQLQWSQWGQFHETNGEKGQEVDLPEAQRLMELYQKWQDSAEIGDKQRIWGEILSIHSEQVYTLGIINRVPQPVVVSDRLKGVPVEGTYSWSPTSFFGLYHPDTFWINE